MSTKESVTVTLDRLQEDDVQLVYEAAVERGASFADFLSELRPTLEAPSRSPGVSEGMEEVMDRLRRFREERGWEKDHTPTNLAVAIAVETGELLEHFQWGEPLSPPFVAGELADVLIYALNLADVLDIDPVKAVNEKITTNEMRFPAPGSTRPVGGA